jgi:type IV pilus assembly protein PilM
MATSKPVWAIDIGNCSLKALRIQQAAEKIEVVGLDYIEHTKILSAEGITEEEKNQIIRSTLKTLAGRNDLSKDPIAISVPGQTSFARFIKLPPVDPKRVPEIVKFEAVQQIPFDINEVEWDWQLMPKPDSPDTEVGIFAIKNELVGKHLENFTAENLRITVVQMAPIALYNYAWFDRNDLDDTDKKAVVILDMGADNTNLVICSKSTVWQRCIPLGGNSFTKAIAEAFKLNFEKAEKLKRGAPVSKYVRQIFQAMKPVFTDFGAEVQRSLGYYSSSHKNTTFTKIVLLGGSFRLQGLNKYLQQTTQLPVVRPDSFEKLTSAANVSTAKLHENIADFGIVYGLGLQALGLAKIQSNLLPKKIARSMLWAQKSKYFTIAAVILLAVSLLALLRTSMDLIAYGSKEAQNKRSETEVVIRQAQNAIDNLKKEQSRDINYENTIKQYMNIFKYRDAVPLLHEVILKTLPNAQNNPAQAELYSAYESGDIEKIKQTPREQRKQIFITSIRLNYTESLAGAPLEVTQQSAKASSSYGGSRNISVEDQGGSATGVQTFKLPTQTQTVSTSASQEGQTDGKGFVVVIEGYTPYEKIGELMDPTEAGNDPNKWGVITRMLNPDKITDGNCPFKLFQKNNIEHFKLETDIIDTKDLQMMPAGIGIQEIKIRASTEDQTATESSGTARLRGGSTDTADRVTSETVLIDPLTREEICKTFDLDNKGRKKYNNFGQLLYIERDKWFRIRAKFLWKDAP